MLKAPSSARLCASVLPKPMPGSTISRARGMPARSQAVDAGARANRRRRARRRRSAGRPAWCADRPARASGRPAGRVSAATCKAAGIVRQRRDVVDDVRRPPAPRAASPRPCACRSRGAHGAPWRQRLDHRHDAPAAPPRGPPARRRAASTRRRCRGCRRPRASSRSACAIAASACQIAAAVGEAVGRDVDDAHDAAAGRGPGRRWASRRRPRRSSSSRQARLAEQRRRPTDAPADLAAIALDQLGGGEQQIAAACHGKLSTCARSRRDARHRPNVDALIRHLSSRHPAPGAGHHGSAVRMPAGPPLVLMVPAFCSDLPAETGEAHHRDLLLDHALHQQRLAVGGPGDALAPLADRQLARLGELRAVAGPHLEQAVGVEERRARRGLLVPFMTVTATNLPSGDILMPSGVCADACRY